MCTVAAIFFLMRRPPPTSTLFPYTTLFRSSWTSSRATKWKIRSPSGRRYSHVSFGSSQTKRRSEEHTSELQSRQYLVCRLLLEKKQPPPAETRAARCASRASPPPAPCQD